MGIEFLSSTWRIDFIVSLASLPVTTGFVLLRAYVRQFMVKSFGTDDWVLLAMQTFSIASTSAQLAFAGSDVTNLTTMRQHIHLFISCGVTYYITILLLKISLALFYLRFLVEKWQRWTVWICVIVFGMIAIPTSMVTIFYCGPPQFFIQNYIAKKCLPWSVVGGLSYTYGVTDAITNWILALLPVTVIRHSQMGTKTKSVACVLLGLGAISSVISLVRLAYINEIDFIGRTTIFAAIETSDNLSEIFPAARITLLSVAECVIGTIAASAAALRPLFRALRDGSKNSSTDQVEPKSIKFLRIMSRGKIGVVSNPFSVREADAQQPNIMGVLSPARPEKDSTTEKSLSDKGGSTLQSQLGFQVE